MSNLISTIFRGTCLTSSILAFSGTARIQMRVFVSSALRFHFRFTLRTLYTPNNLFNRFFILFANIVIYIISSFEFPEIINCIIDFLRFYIILYYIICMCTRVRARAHIHYIYNINKFCRNKVYSAKVAKID